MNMRKFGEKTVLSFYITENQFFNIIRWIIIIENTKST
jgi:hypothetical protein